MKTIKSITITLLILLPIFSSDKWIIHTSSDAGISEPGYFRYETPGNFNNNSLLIQFLYGPQSAYVNRNEWIRFPLAESTTPYKERFIDRIIFQNDSVVWTAGEQKNEILRVNLKTDTYRIFTAEDFGDSITQLASTPAAILPTGEMWFPIYYRGGNTLSHLCVMIYSKGNWTIYDTLNSPVQSTGQYPRPKLIDSSGTAWLIQHNNILRYKDHTWDKIKLTDICALDTAKLIFGECGTDGQVWLAADTMILRLNEDSTWTSWNAKQLWGIGYINKIMQGPNGEIWLSHRYNDFYGPDKPYIATALYKDGEWTFSEASNREDIVILGEFKHIDQWNNAWFYTQDGPVSFNGTTYKLWETGFSSQVSSITFANAFDKMWGRIKVDSTSQSYASYVPVSFDGEKWQLHSPGVSRLVSDEVYCMLPISKHKKWFATSKGISQLDSGNTWSIWDSNNAPFATTSIKAMALDSSGNIWVGSDSWDTDAALARYDGNTWITYTTENSEIPSNEIYDLAVGKDGTLWIAHDNGISSFKNELFTSWDGSENLPDKKASALSIDKSDNLWVATNKGAAKFDGSEWTTYDTTNTNLQRNYLMDVTVDTEGTIWFASLYNGVLSFDGTSFTIYDSSNSPIENDVRSIKADALGNIWTGSNSTTTFGAAKFDGETWTIYDTENSELPSNKVTGIAFDKDGSKWFSTYGGGVAHLNDGDSIPVANSGKVISPMKTKTTLTAGNNQINFSLADNSPVKVQLFDLRGRVVLEKDMGTLNSGNHSLSLKQNISRGFYIVKMVTPKQSILAKMMVR